MHEEGSVTNILNVVIHCRESAPSIISTHIMVIGVRTEYIG